METSVYQLDAQIFSSVNVKRNLLSFLRFCLGLGRYKKRGEKKAK